jgi:transposase
MAKRGRGRPVVFKGHEKRHILAVIRKHGLTNGRAVLAKEKVSISLPTLGKFAAEAGIELSRGRPSMAA